MSAAASDVLHCCGNYPTSSWRSRTSGRSSHFRICSQVRRHSFDLASLDFFDCCTDTVLVLDGQRSRSSIAGAACILCSGDNHLRPSGCHANIHANIAAMTHCGLCKTMSGSQLHVEKDDTTQVLRCRACGSFLVAGLWVVRAGRSCNRHRASGRRNNLVLADEPEIRSSRRVSFSFR